MTVKLSTGARNAAFTPGLKTALNLGFIRIFGGTEPVTADAAESPDLLCIISVNATGTGLTTEAPAGGGVIKATAEVWKGVNLDSGTATHMRFVAAGDTGASSATQVRIQGTVGTAGEDLNLSSVNLTNGAEQTIDSGSIVLPTY